MGIKKQIRCVIAFAVLIGEAAVAAAELYPPQFAPLFTEFRAVTPDEAVGAVVLYGNEPSDLASNAKIFTPIAIKCPNGLLAEYVVIAYNGEEPQVIKAIQSISEMLAEGNYFDFAKASEYAEVISGNCTGLSSYSVSAWTWGSPVLAKGFGGDPICIRFFPGHYHNIKKNNPTLTRVKLCLSNPYVGTIVYCVPCNGRVIYYQAHIDNIFPMDKAALVRSYIKGLTALYNNYREYRGEFINSRNAWEKVFETDIEDYKNGGYYRVQEFTGSY